MKATKPVSKGRPDWEAIERDYRTGRYTLRELEAMHGASYAHISRKAKAQEWSKDLQQVIRQATNAAVLRETTTRAQHEATETVLVAAEINKSVILQHRGDIAATRSLAMELLGEIKVATSSQEDLAALLKMAQSGMDATDAMLLQQALRDLTKLHNRVGSTHKLADTLTKLQTLERKAFGIEDEDGGEEKSTPAAQILGEMMAAMHQAGGSTMPIATRAKR